MITTTDPRPFINHLLLATAWARYTSRRGTATAAQIARIMRQCTAEELHRMLSKRHALPQDAQ